ncbi:hypothetical protein [Maribacter sp. Asnod2-G09]|uniref:hypothetical protein n=1 Tax=Maribacter sp. Asnod2-G09 TaxID=3160577 RepID=UPI0038630B83
MAINKLKLFFREVKIFKKFYNYLNSLRTKLINQKVLNQLRDLENKSEVNLFNKQQALLNNMLSYAYKNTEYYKQLFNSNNVKIENGYDLKKIPFLTKEIIRSNTKELISNEYGIQSLGKRNTGGSTGEPLEFYCSTMAGLSDFGHHNYLYSLMGYKSSDIILSCGGIEIDKELRAKNIFWTKGNKGDLFGDYRFSVLYLTDHNIHIYVNKLILIKPAILRGYPSFFYSLARYILEHNIIIGFKIKGINLTAEMCSPEQRIIIEKAFSSMVFFEYGHSEVSLYCYTKDKTYIYESSPIYGYIEVLNEDGTETKIGEVGNIITTGFINYGMPFIRYKTGDLGKLVYRNGGIVHFSEIYGRTQDYIISKENQKVYLTALIFGQHLKAFAKIKKWQIRQNTIGEINFHIVKDINYSKSDELDILEKINSVTNVEISFKYVDSIQTTKSGKHLFLLQEIK